MLVSIAPLFILSQGSLEAIANPSTWENTLTQVGPLGLVAIFLIYLLREERRASALATAEHLKRIEEYHSQEKARADKLVQVVETNTKAMTELTLAVGHFSEDLERITTEVCQERRD